MGDIFLWFWDLFNADLFNAFGYDFSIYDVVIVLFLCTLLGFIIDMLLNALSHKYF